MKQDEAKPQRRKKSGEPVRAHGTGSLYLSRSSRNWMAKFYDLRGKPIHRSTGTSDRRKAEATLRGWLTDSSRGELPSTKQRRVTIEELVALVIADYRAKNHRSTSYIVGRWENHLKARFGGNYRAEALTSTAISKYVTDKLAAGCAVATVNRTLALLRRGFRLGFQAEPPLVKRVPRITLLPEDNARLQFADAQQLEALRQAAAKHSLWLRTFVEVAVSVGWRCKEILGLRVSMFDRIDGVLTLPASMSKNKKPRSVVVGSLSRQLLTQLCAGKQPADYVFTRDNGERVRDMRRAWEATCLEAGLAKLECKTCGTVVVRESERVLRCPTCDQTRSRGQIRHVGFLIHSLRRTCARNLVASGVSENATMRICGWRTRAMLDRYDVVDVETMASAQEMLELKTRRDLERLAGENGKLTATYAPKTGLETALIPESEGLEN
jgi:integrase